MNINENICKLCNKKYASYKSWWNHNKKFHSDIPKISPNPQMDIPNKSPLINNKINQRVCEYCNKELSSYKNLHRHLQTCKYKDKINLIITKLTDQNLELSNKLNNISQELKEVKNNIQIKNSNNNINSNNTINNINIIELGKERDYPDVSII